MKLRIGHWDRSQGIQSQGTIEGTIEDTPQGLRYTGNVASLQRLVASIAGPERPENAPGGLPGFMTFLQRQTNNGYLWCAVVPPEADDGDDGSSDEDGGTATQ